MLLGMSEPFERLRQARAKAGYRGPTDAAEAFGWNDVTYTSHENGARGIRPAIAERYAKAFRVLPEWILYGKELTPKKAQPTAPKTIRVIGYVSSGATVHYYGERDEPAPIPAPDSATESTVALEVHGDGLGPFFDGWHVFYDDIRRPATFDLFNRLCVVGLPEGRVVVAKIQRSRTRRLFHLIPQLGAPIMDAAVEWAVKVRDLRARE